MCEMNILRHKSADALGKEAHYLDALDMYWMADNFKGFVVWDPVFNEAQAQECFDWLCKKLKERNGDFVRLGCSLITGRYYIEISGDDMHRTCYADAKNIAILNAVIAESKNENTSD